MKVRHTYRGTQHRVELDLGGRPKAGPWASYTSPATVELNPRERVVLVTAHWRGQLPFPAPEKAYLVTLLAEEVIPAT